LKILRDLNLNKKIISEEDLYIDRKNRLEVQNSSFMQKKLFTLTNFLVNFLKKILV
jgi:hypothetical protein